MCICKERKFGVESFYFYSFSLGEGWKGSYVLRWRLLVCEKKCRDVPMLLFRLFPHGHPPSVLLPFVSPMAKLLCLELTSK